MINYIVMLTYQNIKNNSTRSLDCKIYRDEYWDYMLYRGEAYGCFNVDNQLLADFSSLNIEDGILYSTVKWQDAVNEGVLMEDIGFTGIDNGLIHFRKDRISNQDFLNILTGSTYDIPEGDTRFFLSPVTGNTLDFEYPMYYNDDEKYISFQGGFYQGFYKLHGFKYQTLPNGPDTEWGLYFKLRPRTDYEIGVRTVNHIHPENNGLFFYMGTRAENKFSNLYKMDSAVTETLKRENVMTDGYFAPYTCDESGDTVDLQNKIVHVKDYLTDLTEDERPVHMDYYNDGSVECERRNPISYFDDNYIDMDSMNFCWEEKEEPKPQPKPKPKYKPYPYDGCECHITSIPDYDWHVSSLYDYKYEEDSHCCDSCPKPQPKPEKPDCADYFGDEYSHKDICPDSDKSIEEGYFADDADIDEKKIADTFGHLITKKGYYQIESDNKFLMFDRTPEGFTTKNWIENTKVTLTGRQDWSNINYFPIMNRTSTGYTVHDIYKYQEENAIPYNIYKDIKNNTFGLRITENGAIGYRYGVLDCDADNDQHYTVEEEYSKDGIIKPDEWNTVYVRIVIINPSSEKCDRYKGKRKMRLYFYVNGFLKFISKELNEFNFRELNDDYQKQEAVPFSISLGGGTQGLLETILPDYYWTSNYIFPIEKSFCGTFIGDIKDFRIYDGFVNFSIINNDFLC